MSEISDQEILKPYLDRIPEVEAEVFERFFFQDKNALTIAKELNLAPKRVRGWRDVAIKRLKFLFDYPEFDAEVMYTDCLEILQDAKEKQRKERKKRKKKFDHGGGRPLPIEKIALVMKTMYLVGNQREVQDQLGFNQVVLSSWLRRGIKELKQVYTQKPIYEEYLIALTMVVDNPYMITPIADPQLPDRRSRNQKRGYAYGRPVHTI